MSLFACPGVMPECPLCQSYDTAYACIDPLRLKHVAEMGPLFGSNTEKKSFVHRGLEGVRQFSPFSRLRASPSQ